VGLLRKQPKQGQASDWIQPGQMIAQFGGPGAPGAPGPAAGLPVPARLRPVTTAGQGDWLPGALRLAPGSLLWEPDGGVGSASVELATATMIPAPGNRPGKHGTLVDLVTPDGRFELEMDPVLFGMSQELVAEEAAKRHGSAADPGAF